MYEVKLGKVVFQPLFGFQMAGLRTVPPRGANHLL